MNKVLFSIYSYPRKNNKTPLVFERMCKTLFQNIPKDMNIEILVIGDDYSNMEKDFDPILRPLKIKYTLTNINKNNALRNMNAHKRLKWQHACTRSIIYGFKKSLECDFDYTIGFSDDDYYHKNYLTYVNSFIKTYSNVDLIYSMGLYLGKKIMPREIHKILTKNSPTSGNVIATGIVFKSKNEVFIKDIINLLETRWNNVLRNLDKSDRPNDAIMWEYLKHKFDTNEYKSVIIPKCLVFHDTEFTIFNNI